MLVLLCKNTSDCLYGIHSRAFMCHTVLFYCDDMRHQARRRVKTSVRPCGLVDLPTVVSLLAQDIILLC